MDGQPFITIKKLLIVCGAITLIIAGVLGIPALAPLFLAQQIPQVQTPNCQITQADEEVRGSSLEPLVRNGDTITLLRGYYGCNEVKRGDIVIYNYAGNSVPLIKIAQGVPGDTFALEETQGGGRWHILINGEAAKNSEGIPYAISSARKNLLSLYREDYDGIIPPNAYLILGNEPAGSVDSTQFGLVSKEDIIAKAVLSSSASVSAFFKLNDFPPFQWITSLIRR